MACWVNHWSDPDERNEIQLFSNASFHHETVNTGWLRTVECAIQPLAGKYGPVYIFTGNYMEPGKDIIWRGVVVRKAVSHWCYKLLAVKDPIRPGFFFYDCYRSRNDASAELKTTSSFRCTLQEINVATAQAFLANVSHEQRDLLNEVMGIPSVSTVWRRNKRSIIHTTNDTESIPLKKPNLEARNAELEARNEDFAFYEF